MLNPDKPAGGSVAACIHAGLPAQHIRGCAAQTQMRPPRWPMNSAASLLTSTTMSSRYGREGPAATCGTAPDITVSLRRRVRVQLSESPGGLRDLGP